MAACIGYQDVLGPITTNEPAWSGAARSIIEYTDGCWFGFEVPQTSVGVIVGLNTENEGEHYLEIDHALHFSRGTVRSRQSGTTTPGFGPIPYAEGDRFYIMRIDAEVLYMHRPATTNDEDYYSDSRFPGRQLPGGILYVSRRSSYGTVFLDISMYAVGDRILNETSGETWYASDTAIPGVPGSEGGSEGSGPAVGSGAVLTLPYALAFAANADTWAELDLSYSIDAGGSTGSGVSAELPFTVLGADTELETLMIGELPFTVAAEGSEDGSSVYTPLSGITGPLLFDVEASSTVRTAGADIEQPFVIAAYGSSAGVPLNTVALLEYPFNLFMTGSGGAEIPITGGASLEMPFVVQATGSDPTDVVINAAAILEQPFVLTATGHADDDLSPTAGVFGYLTYTSTGSSSELYTDYFNILLTFNELADLPIEPVEILEGVEISVRVQAQYVLLLRDFLSIVETAKTFSTQATEVLDVARVVAEAVPGFSLLIQDLLSIDDTLTASQAIELADALVASGMVQTYYQATVAILSAVLISDGGAGANPVGSGAILDATGTSGDPAEIALYGWFPLGSIIGIAYTANVGGPDSVSYTLTQHQTGEQVAQRLVALLDAKTYISSTYAGAGVIQILPANGATTVTI